MILRAAATVPAAEKLTDLREVRGSAGKPFPVPRDLIQGLDREPDEVLDRCRVRGRGGGTEPGRQLPQGGVADRADRDVLGLKLDRPEELVRCFEICGPRGQPDRGTDGQEPRDKGGNLAQ